MSTMLGNRNKITIKYSKSSNHRRKLHTETWRRNQQLSDCIKIIAWIHI